MIAVARQQRTSDDVSGDEVRDQERDDLLKVDALREIGLKTDILTDDLADPLQRFGSDALLPIARLQSLAQGEAIAPSVRAADRLDDDAREPEVDEEEDVEVAPESDTADVSVEPPPEAPPPEEPDDVGDPADRPEQPSAATPPAPAGPPPEPPPPIAGDTAAALFAAFAAAGPTQKARERESVAEQMEAAASGEQGTVQESVPTLHAKLDDNTPLADGSTAEAGGSANVEVPVTSAALDTSASGPVPHATLAPTPKPTAPAINAEALLDNAPDPSQLTEAAVLEALQSVPTSDATLSASPGPAPQVPLAGAADPSQVAAKLAGGVDAVHDAQVAAANAVLQSKGESLVAPEVLDEAFEPGQLAPVELEDAPDIQGMVEYTNLDLGAEVQAQFDAMYADEMEASLAPAADQLGEATEQRDLGVETEVARAHEEVAKLNADAQLEQDKLVAEQRELIRAKKSETIAAQQEAVAELHEQADKEQAKVQGQIAERIAKDNAQIEKHFAEAEDKAAAEIAQGEKKAKEAKTEAAGEEEKKSWWSDAVGAVSNFVDKVATAINDVFDAVREAVAAVLDAVKEVANSLIDAAVSWVSDQISAFGTWLKSAIDDVLGEAFPKLAAALTAFVDEAVTFANSRIAAYGEMLKKSIAGLCDVVLGVLDGLIATWKAAVEATRAVMAAVLAGDWEALGRMVLHAVLAVCGIDKDQFYAMIGNAEETIDVIVKSPGVFVGHAIDAVKLGFDNFADGFLDHLKTGMLDWLTGELGDLKIPEVLDGKGILDLVLQVSGIGMHTIREKAVQHIGEENVNKIEWVIGLVNEVVTESDNNGGSGIAGIWTVAENHIDDIYGDVIGNIQNWLMERVVRAAVLKLATMFNPIGAIVQLVLTAWNLYNWLTENAKRIYGVISAWVGSMHEIATGKIGGAAARVEEALAGLVPIAISLLANVLGLRGVTKKVRDTIEKVRAKVDAALDKVIEKFLSIFPEGWFGDDEEEKDDADPQAGEETEEGEEKTVGELVKEAADDAIEVVTTALDPTNEQKASVDVAPKVQVPSVTDPETFRKATYLYFSSRDDDLRALDQWLKEVAGATVGSPDWWRAVGQAADAAEHWLTVNAAGNKKRASGAGDRLPAVLELWNGLLSLKAGKPIRRDPPGGASAADEGVTFAGAVDTTETALKGVGAVAGIAGTGLDALKDAGVGNPVKMQKAAASFGGGAAIAGTLTEAIDFGKGIAEAKSDPAMTTDQKVDFGVARTQNLIGMAKGVADTIDSVTKAAQGTGVGNAVASTTGGVLGVASGGIDIAHGAYKVGTAFNNKRNLDRTGKSADEALALLLDEKKRLEAEESVKRAEAAATGSKAVAAAVERRWRARIARLDAEIASLREKKREYDEAAAAMAQVQNRRMAGGALKMATGTLDVVSGALTLSGVGAPVAVALATLSTLIKLGSAGLDAGRKWKANKLTNVALRLEDSGRAKGKPDDPADVGYRRMELRARNAYALNYLRAFSDDTPPMGLTVDQWIEVRDYVLEEKLNKVKEREENVFERADADSQPRSLKDTKWGVAQDQGKTVMKEFPGRARRAGMVFTFAAAKSEQAIDASNAELAEALVRIGMGAYHPDTRDFVPTQVLPAGGGGAEKVQQQMATTLLGNVGITASVWTKLWKASGGHFKGETDPATGDRHPQHGPPNVSTLQRLVKSKVDKT